MGDEFEVGRGIGKKPGPACRSAVGVPGRESVRRAGLEWHPASLTIPIAGGKSWRRIDRGHYFWAMRYSSSAIRSINSSLVDV